MSGGGGGKPSSCYKEKEPVRVHTKWNHYNGNTYKVIALANTEGDIESKREKYPPIVVYQGSNNKIWARRLDDWHRSMTPYKKKPVKFLKQLELICVLAFCLGMYIAMSPIAIIWNGTESWFKVCKGHFQAMIRTS